MRIAVIDLGTNTFNLLISQVEKNTAPQNIFQKKIPVKLGEGGINNKKIMSVPFDRGIAALKEFRKNIDEHAAESVIAFATSAIREAINGDEFISVAKQETGFTIRKITGDQEAELIYKGVKNAVHLNNAPALLMDIGGGSTEFIIANNDTIFWKQSFLLGVSRLLQLFNPSDPIKNEESEKIVNYLQQELTPLIAAVEQYSPNVLIGSSGSFESYADIIAHKFYSVDILSNKTSFDFDANQLAQIFTEIIASTLDERKQIKGLIDMRVDMIVMSVLLTQAVIKICNPQKITLSTYSLKEGIIADFLG